MHELASLAGLLQSTCCLLELGAVLAVPEAGHQPHMRSPESELVGEMWQGFVTLVGLLYLTNS